MRTGQRGMGLLPAGMVLILVALTFPAGARRESGEACAQAEYLLIWNGLSMNAEKAALLLRPGSTQTLTFQSANGKALTVLSCKGAPRCRAEEESVSLKAPAEPGNYWLTIQARPRGGQTAKARKRGLLHRQGKARSETAPAAEVTFRVACLVGFPSELIKDGFLNGFELGSYPDLSKMKHPEHYRPPDYFYFLDDKVIGAWISPHFHLGDLGYDGRAALPQYFALNYDLVRKLEVLESELKKRGLPSRIQFIGGGYISPKSNQQRTERNSAAAELSRHMFGEAVDLVIDERPRDQEMDDMNGDGVIDVRDVFVVRDLVTDLEDSGRVTPGGFGVYAPPRNSQLQMHIDVRGYPTRWGYKTYDPQEFSNVQPKKSLRPGAGG